MFIYDRTQEEPIRIEHIFGQVTPNASAFCSGPFYENYHTTTINKSYTYKFILSANLSHTFFMYDRTHKRHDPNTRTLPSLPPPRRTSDPIMIENVVI